LQLESEGDDDEVKPLDTTGDERETQQLVLAMRERERESTDSHMRREREAAGERRPRGVRERERQEARRRRLESGEGSKCEEAFTSGSTNIWLNFSQKTIFIYFSYSLF
jgi:hypothetical protein